MSSTDKTTKAKVASLAQLFVQFPRQEREGTERQLLEGYLMAVEDIPAEFVAMAVKRFIQAQVQRPDIRFRPVAPELAVEARRLRDKALDHERLAMARLPAPPSDDPPEPTPEERQRGAERLRQVAAEIRACAESMRMPRKNRQDPDYTPKVDVSDFPRAGATKAELQAWEKRQKEHAA